MYEEKLNLFTAHGKQSEEETIEFTDLSNPDLEKYVDEKPANELREEVEMVEEVYPEFVQVSLEEIPTTCTFVKIKK
jgi:peptide chain release factor 3